MKILLLAVLLAVVQTNPPIPRQAPDANASKSQTIQNNAETDKAPAKQSPSGVQTATSKPNQNPDSGQRNKDADKPVRIGELPPVSVQSGWRDNVSLIFAGLVVGIGGVGVYAAVRTLQVLRRQTAAIRRQGVSMRRQTRILRNQLKTMAQSIDIENRNLILQYRPKITVRNAKALQFSFDLGKPWECEISLQIINTGGTPAYISAGSYIQALSSIGHDIGKIEMNWGDERPISNAMLQPGQGITLKESLPMGVPFDLNWENFRQGVPTKPLRFARTYLKNEEPR